MTQNDKNFSTYKEQQIENLSEIERQTYRKLALKSIIGYLLIYLIVFLASYGIVLLFKSLK